MSDIPSPRSQTGALDDSDDRRLLRAVADGSERALVTLQHRHHADLLRFVRARMQGHASAEEVVADVFLAVWRRPTSYSGRATVRAWMVGIAKRRVRDARRRAGLLVVPEAELLDVADPAAGPAEAILGQPSAHGLVGATLGLPLQLREVLALAFDQHMTYSQIAAALDIPEGTVRSRLHQARVRLRPFLQAGER